MRDKLFDYITEVADLAYQSGMLDTTYRVDESEFESLLDELHDQEIERAVTIAKSYSINKMVGDKPNVVVPEKLYRELLELNQQMDEVENKSSHIITRVEEITPPKGL